VCCNYRLNKLFSSAHPQVTRRWQKAKRQNPQVGTNDLLMLLVAAKIQHQMYGRVKTNGKEVRCAEDLVRGTHCKGPSFKSLVSSAKCC